MADFRDPKFLELSRAQQAKLGLPEGFKIYSPFPFGGMDVQGSRSGIADNQFFWRENLIRVGPGKLRSTWDRGTSIYDASPRQIASFFLYNLFGNQYAVLFFTDGTAIQIDTSTHVTTNISTTAATFYNGDALPAVVQYGATYILIVNTITADDYWIWDGNILYGAGTIGPTITILAGGTYSSAPTVTAYGGSGSGATFTAVLTGTAVGAVTIDNPGSGYLPGDVVQLAFSGGGGNNSAILTATVVAGSVTAVNIVNGGTGFTSAPTLTIVGGGGSGATATCTVAAGVIDTTTVTNGGVTYDAQTAVVVTPGFNEAAYADVLVLMPFGISGNAIETYQNRIEVALRGTIFVSAPFSLTDFATGDGGVDFVSADRYLRRQYINLRQSNGYLYAISDSAVSVMSNFQTAGDPPSTTFNYQNADPQVGTPWRDTVQDYGRTIVFANPFGIFGLYGGAVTKVSGPLDPIFEKAPSCQIPMPNTALVPTSAVANIFTQKVYLLLLTVEDPRDGASRNIILAWDEREWFIVSQRTNMIYIGTQEIDSQLIAWGTDGNSFFPLLDTPSASITKNLWSKLYGAKDLPIEKEAMVVYLQAADLSTDVSGAAFTVTIDNETTEYLLDHTPTFTARPPRSEVYACKSEDVPGQNLGFTVQSVSKDFEIYNMMLGYIDTSSLYG